MTDTQDRPVDDNPPPESSPAGVSRRGFLKGTGMTVASVGLLGATQAGDAQTQEQADATRFVGPETLSMKLQINGEERTVQAPPSATLLDLVREQWDLTGSKRVCDRGSCGACTMMVDGQVVNSCSYLAIDAVGKKVRTVESFAADGKLTPLQQAFVECDALQCGFCTPGMVVACSALLERNPKPSTDDVRQAISGNLCRCGTYQNIFEAVAKVAGKEVK